MGDPVWPSFDDLGDARQHVFQQVRLNRIARLRNERQLTFVLSQRRSRAVELYALKQDVVKCYSFEHPDTARSVRKIEGAKMAHRIHKLLSCIDGSLETWLRMDGLAWCLKRPGVAWALKKQLKMPRISARH
jgi:hypothetical protein